MPSNYFVVDDAARLLRLANNGEKRSILLKNATKEATTAVSVPLHTITPTDYGVRRTVRPVHGTAFT